MSNPVKLEPHPNLAQWLRYSFGYTAACMAVCGLVWYLCVIVGDCLTVGRSGGSALLFLLLMCLVLGCVLVSQQAIPAAWPGAGPGRAPEAGWLRLLALTWWVALEVLRLAWWALNVMMLLCWLLSIADDGRPWYS